MRVLKKKYRKKKKLPKLIKIPTKLKPIKIKPKIGRWCEYYDGHLPYPMECSYNKKMSVSAVFKGVEKTILRNFPNCENCNRAVDYTSWKSGLWDKVKEAIAKGEDLTDMDSPIRRT